MTTASTHSTQPHAGGVPAETPPASEPTYGPLTTEELQLAARNHGMPLEALRYDITPVGLHYLLVHFDIPHLDADTWHLTISGEVTNPLTLGLDDLRARPQQTVPVTLECAGNGRARLTPRPISQPWLNEAVGTSEWSGTPLGPLLTEAGLTGDASDVVFIGADHGIQGGEEQDYARSLTVAQATRPEVMLVHSMNGMPLSPQHGFPARLLVPGWYGMASVKWLASIEVRKGPFDGYQQNVSYRYQQDADDPGEPVSRIRVRALMTPPGVPEFLTRHRIVDAGLVELHGRAWSGNGAVERVEVAVDGVWSDAETHPPLGDFAWCSWTFLWDAQPGEHVLACRGTDSSGAVQPVTSHWNYQGMSNTGAQEVAVTVR